MALEIPLLVWALVATIVAARAVQNTFVHFRAHRRDQPARDGIPADGRLRVGVNPSGAERARRLLLRVAIRDPRVRSASVPLIVARMPRACTLEIRVDLESGTDPDYVFSDLRFAIASTFADEGLVLRPPTSAAPRET